MAVGVFDSGLGGLTVLGAGLERLPTCLSSISATMRIPLTAPATRRHLRADLRRGRTALGRRLRPGDPGLQHRVCRRAAAHAGNLGAARQARAGRVRAADRGADRTPMGRQFPPARGGGQACRAVRHAQRPCPAVRFQRELAFRAIGVDVEAQPCGGVVDAIELGDMILAEALVHSHVESLCGACRTRRPPFWAARITRCWKTRFAPRLAPMSRSIRSPTLWRTACPITWTAPGMIGRGAHSLFLTTGDAANVSRKATQFLRRQITFNRPDHHLAEKYSGHAACHALRSRRGNTP